MAKSEFLKYFQENLKDCIEDLIENEWGYKELQVCTEDGCLPGKFKGYMDICVFNENDENSNSIVAIEIEHLSDSKQAHRNIEKLKAWSHNSTYRKCGLLHIFNEDCNIHPNKIDGLVRYARDNQQKNHGFFYDFIFYQVDDHRKTKELAKEIVNSINFQSRLWMLLEDANILQAK
jgi:hypothetical protein